MISAGFGTGIYGFPTGNVPRRGCRDLVRFHAGNKRFLARGISCENAHSGGVISCGFQVSQCLLARGRRLRFVVVEPRKGDAAVLARGAGAHRAGRRGAALVRLQRHPPPADAVTRGRGVARFVVVLLINGVKENPGPAATHAAAECHCLCRFAVNDAHSEDDASTCLRSIGSKQLPHWEIWRP